jgi:nicotinamidase/pyrazinamidase
MLRYRPGVALLVVDVQNDFADPAGSLYVDGGERVVPVINGQIKLAASNGALVAYTQDWHPGHTPHFAQDGGIWPVHCVRLTWGSEFHPDLDVHPEAEVVHKGSSGEDGYSGFTMRDPHTLETVPTALEAVLRDANVTDVVVAGLATDYCVKETALDAVRLGFHTTVLTDAIAAVELQDGDGGRALDQLREAGVTLSNTRVR